MWCKPRQMELKYGDIGRVVQHFPWSKIRWFFYLLTFLYFFRDLKVACLDCHSVGVRQGAISVEAADGQESYVSVDDKDFSLDDIDLPLEEFSSKESLDPDGLTKTHTPKPDYSSATSMDPKLYRSATTSMDPKLYRSATTGDISAFKDIERSLLDQVSPRGNTVLHLAASLGHDQLVKLILHRFPDLVKRTNYKGDLALHVAACGGHLSTVEALVTKSPRLDLEAGETEVNDVLKKVNNEGNTALHVALENRHQEVAKFLIKGDRTGSHYWLREEKSSLCMAAKAGYRDLVDLMIDNNPVRGDNSNEKLKGKSVVHPVDDLKTIEESDESCRLDRFYSAKEVFKGKSLLHAAIIGRNRDILEAILRVGATLINSVDEEGRTPLSFATHIGYLDGVRCLLDISKDGTYLRNYNGSFPVHLASSIGHIKIVHEFLKHCPDSRELLDQQGRNILHVAAMFGKAKLVSYMLRRRQLEMLINEKDYRGNTPLHLATMNWRPKVVSSLAWDKKIRLEMVNNDRLTAMDVAEKCIGTMPEFLKLLTLTTLKSANAPRSEHRSTIGANLECYSSFEPPNKEQYKERVNILLLVSTLVATVTFAAGFTIPGGINSSGLDQGMASLVKKHTFYAFLICNTTAMYSSIIVAISLIFAQLGELNLILTALNLALPFLGIAVIMMSLAFMAGVYLVVSNLIWLANVVLIMGLIFLITVLGLFVLLYSPISSNHYIARYVFYYPLQLIIFDRK